MPSYAASARILRGSGQAIWSALACCPCSRRPTPDEKRHSLLQKPFVTEFGTLGLAYSHGTFAVEAQNLARVKGDFCLGIANFGSINFDASLFDESRDFAVRFF